MLREALHERRSYSSDPVPAAYTNLTGPLSLCSADPAWARLCERGGALPEVGLANPNPNPTLNPNPNPNPNPTPKLPRSMCRTPSAPPTPHHATPHTR